MKLASEWAESMKQDENDNQFVVGWKLNSINSVEDAIRVLQANGFDVLQY